MSYSVGKGASKGGTEARWISLFVLSIAYVTRCFWLPDLVCAAPA